MNTQKTNSQNTERKRKLIITGVIVSALVLVAIFSTLAYLTSTTNTLDNVMTAGKIEAFLDEAKTSEYGVAESTRIPTDPAKTKTTGNTYTLIPGHEYSKDPQMHVKAESEPCYAYIIIDDKMISAISNVYKTGTKSPEAQMVDNNWIKLDGVTLPTGMTGNVYYYKDIVNAKEAQQNLDTFANFTLNPDLTNDQITTLGTTEIIVNGAAIQSDGFASAQAAWEAVYGGGGKKEAKITATGLQEQPAVNNVNVGTTLPFTANTDAGTTLTAASGDTSIATVTAAASNADQSFTITGVKAGLTTITLTSPETTEYKKTEKSYNVTVAGSKQETTITINDAPAGGFQVNAVGDSSTTPLKFTTNDTTATPTVSVTKQTNNGLAVSDPTGTGTAGQYKCTLTGSAYEDNAQVTITIPGSESYTGATKVVDVKVNRVDPGNITATPAPNIVDQLGEYDCAYSNNSNGLGFSSIDKIEGEGDVAVLGNQVSAAGSATYTFYALENPGKVKVTTGTSQTLQYNEAKSEYYVTVQKKSASISPELPAGGTISIDAVGDGSTYELRFTTTNTEAEPADITVTPSGDGLSAGTVEAHEEGSGFKSMLTGSAYNQSATVTITVGETASYSEAKYENIPVKINRVDPTEDTEATKAPDSTVALDGTTDGLYKNNSNGTGYASIVAGNEYLSMPSSPVTGEGEVSYTLKAGNTGGSATVTVGTPATPQYNSATKSYTVYVAQQASLETDMSGAYTDIAVGETQTYYAYSPESDGAISVEEFSEEAENILNITTEPREGGGINFSITPKDGLEIPESGLLTHVDIRLADTESYKGTEKAGSFYIKPSGPEPKTYNLLPQPSSGTVAKPAEGAPSQSATTTLYDSTGSSKITYGTNFSVKCYTDEEYTTEVEPSLYGIETPTYMKKNGLVTFPCNSTGKTGTVYMEIGITDKEGTELLGKYQLTIK